jgi:hypothetical protein
LGFRLREGKISENGKTAFPMMMMTMSSNHQIELWKVREVGGGRIGERRWKFTACGW